MKKILLVSLLIILSGCQTFDNTVYKYGNGVLHAFDGAGKAIACVATGGYTCAVAGAVTGYIEGKQEAREKIVAKADARTIKKLAEKGAGIEDDCWFFCD